MSVLDVHEISRGALRQQSLDKLFCLLVVCRRCHEELGSRKTWPEARQLAVLRYRRPDDYDLAAYNELVNPRAPQRITETEVEQYRVAK